MKYLTTIIKRFLPKELPKPVGRWRNENCDKQLNQKIDLSNEDHCGPCGQYAIIKLDVKKPPTTPSPSSSLK
jgi:hypothetical protein